MNYIECDEEYKKIVAPIMSNEEFVSSMDNIRHHDSTRLNHMLKVSYKSYKIAKTLKLDYEEVARAGLLHDYYLESVYEQDKIKDKVALYTINHPKTAVENAKEIFGINDKEEDIIRTHMFPIDVKVPKYAESWIVSFVDKGVSTVEFARKFGYQLKSSTNIMAIFILNVLRMF